MTESHAAQVDRLAEEVRKAARAWYESAAFPFHERVIASTNFFDALSRLIAFAKADKEQR